MQYSILLVTPVSRVRVLGLSPHSTPNSSFLGTCTLEAAGDGSHSQVPASHVRDPHGVPGFCLRPGPASPVADIWGVNQRAEDSAFSFSLSLYIVIYIFIFLLIKIYTFILIFIYVEIYIYIYTHTYISTIHIHKENSGKISILVQKNFKIHAQRGLLKVHEECV